MSGTVRYSDEELDLFRILIEQKLEKANSELNFLQGQIQDITESIDNIGDWMDDPSSRDVEMLSTMISRQRHHIRDLENALIRVKNKNYGICVVTGELIDKRRLLAVLTTTKSLAAKNAPQEEEKPIRKSNGRKRDKTKMITRVIRNTSIAEHMSDDEDDDYDSIDEDWIDQSEFDTIDENMDNDSN